MSELIEKAKREIRTFERCSRSTCEELVAEIERLLDMGDDGTIAPQPGDLDEVLKFAFSHGAGYDHPLKMSDADKARFKEGRRVPISTHQRINAALERSSLWRFWRDKAVEVAEKLGNQRKLREAVPPMPETKDREPFIDVLGNDIGYVEGDADWAGSNPEAVTWLIDNHAAIRKAIAC